MSGHSADNDADLCHNEECCLPFGHDGLHRSHMAPTAENDAPDAGCTCAEVAEVVGFRLTDDQIIAVCDRLRARVTPPASTGEGA